MMVVLTVRYYRETQVGSILYIKYVGRLMVTHSCVPNKPGMNNLSTFGIVQSGNSLLFCYVPHDEQVIS